MKYIETGKGDVKSWWLMCPNIKYTYIFIFYRDNAPVHKVRSSEQWLENNVTQCIMRPGQFLDLNIIAYICDFFSRMHD